MDVQSKSEILAISLPRGFGVPKGERRNYKTWEENDVAPSVVIELSSRGTWQRPYRKKGFV